MSNKLAERLRSQADAMQKNIDAKLNPAIGNQRVTRRRAAIAESMRNDGYVLQKQQSILRALADLHEFGQFPQMVAGIKERAFIENMLTYERAPVGDHEWDKARRKQLERNGVALADYEPVRAYLLGLLTPESPQQAAQRKIKELERELIGCKIPGFFPTPEQVVRQMLDEADMQPGHNVLEPSAGMGHIADLIREDYPASPLVCFEIHHTLYEIMYHKRDTLWKGGAKVSVICDDFLKLSSHCPESVKYDRVLMNPPFENGQDADHVRHAYEFLKDNGRLVAIMGEGIFYRSDKKATEFRQWLYDVGGLCYKLPEGSFYSSFRPTGVATRLVVIDRSPVVDPDDDGGEGFDDGGDFDIEETEAERVQREAWEHATMRAASAEHAEYRQAFIGDLRARGVDICDWLDERDIPHHSAEAERYAVMAGCSRVTFSENRTRREKERTMAASRGAALSRQTDLLRAQAA